MPHGPWIGRGLSRFNLSRQMPVSEVQKPAASLSGPGFRMPAPRALGSLPIAQETRSAPESQQFQYEKHRDADYKRSAPIARRNTEDVVQARAQEMLVDISAECESKEDEENTSRHSIEKFPPGNQDNEMQSG
jgi:hypothetical protein